MVKKLTLFTTVLFYSLFSHALYGELTTKEDIIIQAGKDEVHLGGVGGPINDQSEAVFKKTFYDHFDFELKEYTWEDGRIVSKPDDIEVLKTN